MASRLAIEDKIGTSQAKIVQESMETIVVGDSAFDKPYMFVHAPRYER